jgi:hypothetical protein
MGQPAVRDWYKRIGRPDELRRRALELLTSGAVSAADWRTARESEHERQLLASIVPHASPEPGE